MKKIHRMSSKILQIWYVIELGTKKPYHRKINLKNSTPFSTRHRQPVLSANSRCDGKITPTNGVAFITASLNSRILPEALNSVQGSLGCECLFDRHEHKNTEY